MRVLFFIFSFEGRIGRRAFIAGSFLWILILGGVCGMILWGPATCGYIALVVVLVPALMSSCALQVKRFHDRNRSGWRVLVFLVLLITSPLDPFAGFAFLIEHVVELFLIGGTKGANVYGSRREEAIAVIPAA